MTSAPRRAALTLLAGALAIVPLTRTAQAQDTYPNKPIRLIVGFPPGGGADSVARVIAERIGQELGQPVIIDNRPGAGTTIASDMAFRAPADGYTVYMTMGTIYGMDKVLYKSVKYDGARDFTAICGWATQPLVLATTKSLGVKSVQELVSRAKAEPGKLNYSTSGNGGVLHLATLAFMKATGTDMVHVPFSGGAASVQSVVAGDVQVTFGTAPSVLPMVRAGRIDGLAVSSLKATPAIPGLPSVAESGVPGFDFTVWYGLFGPAKLPPQVVQKLFEASNKALRDPAVQTRLNGTGSEAFISESPAQFEIWAKAEGRRLKELAEQSGAHID